MKKKYWVLIVTISVVLSAFSYLIADSMQKSADDSSQAWIKLEPQLRKSYNLTSQAYPSSVDSKISIRDLTVFLSILDSSGHSLLFYTLDGSLRLLWFPYEGLVYYHYVNGQDVGAI